MQHVRISVKHLTTVPELAAKLTQSSSVVNTGIWTKPRQPRNGTQPGCPPGAAPATRPETFQNQASCEWRKAHHGLKEHQDGQSCCAARGGQGLQSTQASASRPMGAAMPPRGGEQPHSLPALPWGVATSLSFEGLEREGLSRAALQDQPGQACRTGRVRNAMGAPGTDPLLRECSSRHRPRAGDECRGQTELSTLHNRGLWAPATSTVLCPPCLFYLYFSNLLITIF